MSQDSFDSCRLTSSAAIDAPRRGARVLRHLHLAEVHARACCRLKSAAVINAPAYSQATLFACITRAVRWAIPGRNPGAWPADGFFHDERSFKIHHNCIIVKITLAEANGRQQHSQPVPLLYTRWATLCVDFITWPGCLYRCLLLIPLPDLVPPDFHPLFPVQVRTFSWSTAWCCRRETWTRPPLSWLLCW